MMKEFNHIAISAVGFGFHVRDGYIVHNVTNESVGLVTMGLATSIFVTTGVTLF